MSIAIRQTLKQILVAGILISASTIGAVVYANEKAVVVVEYPKEVMAYPSGDRIKWSWTTVFKETGGKVGYKVTGKGYIYDRYGRRWGPWGAPISRGPIEVSAGGRASNSYWCSAPCANAVWPGGYRKITWTGEDANRNPIEVVEKVNLFWEPTITARAGDHGKIVPSGEIKLEFRATKTFTIIPDTGYHVADVKVDGSSVLEDVTDGQYTFTNVECNHTIYVSFERDPVLSVSSTSLDFGTTQTQKSFNISNIGECTLNWNVSKDMPWITISPTSGTNSGTVTVNVNRTGLSVGKYNGTVSVTSNGGIQEIAINMEVPLIDHLAFTSAVQEIPRGFPSEVFTVQARDTSDNPINVEEDLPIILNSNSNTGIFSASRDFANTISQIIIPKGSSSTSFFYKDTTSGNPMIIVSGAGLPVAQNVSIIEAVISITVEGSPAKAGGPITITVETVPNTTGGIATFSIGSKITDRPMTETAPYTGGYEAQPGDDVIDAIVTVMLNGVDYKADDTVTIDTIAPEVVNHGTPDTVDVGSTFTLDFLTEADATVKANVSEVNPNQTELITLVAGTPIEGGTPYTANITVNVTEEERKTIHILATDVAGNQGRLEHYINLQLPIDHLTFASKKQTIGAGFVSDAITLTAKDENNVDTSSLSDVKIALTSSSDTGKFAIITDKFDKPVTEVTLPAGKSSVDFYYKDNTVGIATITAMAAGIDTISQDITLIPAIKDYNSDTIAWTGQDFKISVLSLEGATVTADVSTLNTTQTEPIALNAGEVVDDEYIHYTGSVKVTAKEDALVTVPVTATDAYGNSVDLLLPVEIKNQTKFTITLNPGPNLIHIPVADSRFKTISDLYYFLIDTGIDLQMLLHYDTNIETFQSYGHWSKVGGPEDVELRSYTGLIAILKGTADAKTVTFEGPMFEKTDVPLVLGETGKGINLIGLPVNDPDITTLNDLAKAVGDRLKAIIAQREGKLVSYIEAGDLEVTGGDAFIVIIKPLSKEYFAGMPEWLSETLSKDLANITLHLKGKPWANEEIPATPSISIAKRDLSKTDVMVVQGTTILKETHEALCGLNVTVRNLSTKLSQNDLSACGHAQADVSGRLTKDGKYSVVFVNLSGRPVAKVGNLLRISVEDPNGGFGAESIQHRVTEEDISKGVIVIKDLLLTKIPEHSALLQNYPNPFNPETWIPFQLAEPADVTIKIYDVTGRIIRLLNIGQKPAGTYIDKDKAVYWNGRNDIGEKVSSGVYFYHLQAGDYSVTKRMLVLK